MERLTFKEENVSAFEAAEGEHAIDAHLLEGRIDIQHAKLSIWGQNVTEVFYGTSKPGNMRGR